MSAPLDPASSDSPDISDLPAAGSWTLRHLAALLTANVALALGPWLVRLADTGPVAAAFWRLALAVPILFVLSRREVRSGLRGVSGIGWKTLAVIVGGGVFFAADLASWHIGIEQTKLGNAALFGNSGSLILMVWGLVMARRAPRLLELAAIAAALAGAAMLMGGSLEISHAHLVGDLFCLLAGFFYAFYILMLGSARSKMPPVSLLLVSTLASAPVALAIALMLGETIWPHNWLPLIGLMLGSQVIGQGLLIYSLRHFAPLVIGLALLSQPAVAALAGWLAFGETLQPLDVLGMVLLAGAMALAKAGDRKPAARKA